MIGAGSVKIMENTVDQRIRDLAAVTVYHKPDRLVYHQDLRILIEDVQLIRCLHKFRYAATFFLCLDCKV